MHPYLSQKIYAYLGNPLVGFISGTVSGLIVQVQALFTDDALLKVVGGIGTYAGTTVAILSGLVWMGRLYDEYKPRFIRVCGSLKSLCVRFKNLFFLFGISILLLSGCKIREVFTARTHNRLKADSTEQQFSQVKTTDTRQSASIDTGKTQKRKQLTIKAEFNDRQPAAHHAASADPQQNLYNLMAGYLKSITISAEQESAEQKGSSATSQQTTFKDSTGFKQMAMIMEFIQEQKLKESKSKPDYSWIAWVAVALVILWLVFQLRRNKIPVL